MPLPDSAIEDNLKSFGDSAPDWHALHIQFSALQNSTRHTPVQLSIAANSYEGMVEGGKGLLFVLPGNDLLHVFPSAEEDTVQTALTRLTFMFADDPLVSDDPTGSGSRFTIRYDLGGDLPALRKEMARVVAAGKTPSRGLSMAAPAEAEKRPGTPLTPALLGRMERALASADLTNLMRRQWVSAMVGEAPPQPVFSEVFISIGDLRDTLLPNVDVTASRWLFQHLTETLDRRVLSMLNKPDQLTISGEVSVNLNVNTLLSQEFLNFDASIPAGRRGSIVLELQPIDIFSDLSTYLFARDFAHERGYRICVDGVTSDTLDLVDRVRLGADMVKLINHPVLAEWAREPDSGPGRQRLRRLGLGFIVLTRCDTREQVRAGQQLGLRLFQGRYVESRLSEREAERDRDLARRARRSLPPGKTGPKPPSGTPPVTKTTPS